MTPGLGHTFCTVPGTEALLRLSVTGELGRRGVSRPPTAYEPWISEKWMTVTVSSMSTGRL